VSEGVDFTAVHLSRGDRLARFRITAAQSPERQKYDARQILHLRSRLNLTQEGFARLFGVSLRTVWRWEHKKVNPDLISKEKLSRLVDLVDRLEHLLPPALLVGWLTTPLPDLRNQQPIQLLGSGFGALSVEEWVSARVAPTHSSTMHS
jgi:DNA-binding transcriptional regulator YiaG